MSREIEDLLSSLPPSFSRIKERYSIEIPKTGKQAYAFRVPSQKLEAAWKEAILSIEKSKRWPIAVTCWMEDDISEEDIFSRHFYREERRSGDVSPEAIIERSKSVDVSRFFERQDKLINKAEDFSETLDYLIEEMGFRLKKTPSPAEVDAFAKSCKVKSRHSIERWLLDWELANKIRIDPTNGRHTWYSQEPSYLLFLPITNSWESLAYIHWFGCTYYKTEELIAVGKTWQKKYGAEVFASYGTMLECFVSRPPVTLELAWDLALEHDLVSTYTNGASGTPIRLYARGLENHAQWFFHERP